VGIGCGGLLLLSAAGGIASYFYMRSQADAMLSAAEAAASAAATGNAPGGVPISGTPMCAKAAACCKATMAKTAGPNAAAGEQACNGVLMLSEDVCAKQYEAYKRAATLVSATCP